MTFDDTEDRKHLTRLSLLNAARDLVFERGHEKISIQDITHRAGVGTGTFYNYFETKQDVFTAVLDNYRAKFKEHLEAARADLSDPAMMIAVTLNYYFREAVHNEAWNTFVDTCGLPGEHLLLQDESQCLEDVERGTTAGRFKVEDPAFTQNMISGMVAHTVRGLISGNLDETAPAEATRHILRMLGLPDLVAKALAQGHMPPISAPKRTRPAESNVTPLKVLANA